MADPRLVDYVRRYLNAGYSTDQIEQTLLDVGWNRHDVDEAIIQARSQQPTPMHAPVHTTYIPQHEPAYSEQPVQGQPPRQPDRTQYKSMGIFTKFKMILRHPGIFFESVKSESGFEGPVKYYLFLLFIQIVIANAVLYLSLTLGAAFFDPSLVSPFMSMFALTTVNNFLFANLTLVLSIVVLFVMAWLMNIFLRMFGGKGRMVDTFKGIVYAYTPNVILTLITIPLLLIMLSYLVDPLAGAGLEAIGGMLLVAMLITPLSVIFLIWGLYLELKGLSIFHEISMGRVFTALIVTGAALYAISFALNLALFSLGILII